VSYVRSAREDRANDLSLNTNSLTVDDPNAADSTPPCLFKVVFNYRANLGRRYRMQIEHVSKFDHHHFWKRVVWIDIFVVIQIGLIGLI